MTVALLLCGLALACLPVVDVQLAAAPGFVPAFGAASLLVDGLTAALLLTGAQLDRQRPTLRLGAAYVFSALITIPQLLTSPRESISTPGIGNDVWPWLAGHAGFALMVIWFVLGHDSPLRPGDVKRTVLATGGLAVCLTAAAAWSPASVPSLLAVGDVSRLATSSMGLVILAVTVAAASLIMARLRCRDVLSLWLTVAMLAGAVCVALTLLGGGRFTLGWYAARVLSLVTGSCVLFALLSELLREAGRVADANVRLEQMLQTDVLTGLANRRAFEGALEAEWRRAHREQSAVSLLMIDIDCFKRFNDSYGHPAGDDCLRAVAGAMASQAYRPADVSARIGGEEFAILLPVTEESGALQVAERVRASVANLRVAHAGSGAGHVTVSVGVATIRPFAPNAEALLLVSLADRALYQAKAAGRNRVAGCTAQHAMLAQV